MNNGLMLTAIPEAQVQALLSELAQAGPSGRVRVDVSAMTVSSRAVAAKFRLSERHRDLFRKGVDMPGASLLHKDQIEESARNWHGRHPWLKDFAASARSRL